MTNLNLYPNFGNNDQSPFDSIRRFDEHGKEYWCARELMKLLDLDYLMSEIPLWERDKFRIKTVKEFLDREDLGFLLLELAAVFSMQTSIGYARDASYLYRVAISVYEGQSATALFNCVFSHAIQRANSINNESAFHQYIQLFWQELFPFATKIDHEHFISSRSTVDFLLDGLIPVEVKKEPISKQCVTQLERYMKELSAVRGYLVAPDLSIRIPHNIIFVKLTFDDISERMLPSYIPVEAKLNSRVREFRTLQIR